MRRNRAPRRASRDQTARGDAARALRVDPADAPTIDAMNPTPRSTQPAGRPTPPVARPRGFQLGRVLGVPVYLNASWLLLAVRRDHLVRAGRAAHAARPQPTPAATRWPSAFVVCLLLSVLLHELGHALVARHYGIGVRAITLELLGGYTEMECDSPDPRADCWSRWSGRSSRRVIGVAALGAGSRCPTAPSLDAAGVPAGLEQPRRRRLQRPARPAAGRRPGAAGRRLGDHRQPAHRHASRPAGSAGLVAVGHRRGRSLLLVQAGVVNLVSARLRCCWSRSPCGRARPPPSPTAGWQPRLPRIEPADAEPGRSSRSPAGTPLAEAIRRAAEAGAPSAALGGHRRRPGSVVALVHAQAAARGAGRAAPLGTGGLRRPYAGAAAGRSPPTWRART